MLRKNVAVTMLLCLLLATTAWGADKFTVDAGHAYVGFTVAHFAVSQMTCSFNEISGAVMFDRDDVTKSSVDILINAKSVDTANPERADAVKSEFFLDVEKYPEITFKSKKVTKKGGAYHMTGDLTVRDVTKEVSFPFELKGPLTDPWGNDRLGTQFTLTIDRRDFGINFDRKLKSGEPMLGDEVAINIALEAVAPRE
ncbi:MAG: YceI family protein [Candidatus Krumholzibacteriia bacterium]